MSLHKSWRKTGQNRLKKSWLHSMPCWPPKIRACRAIQPDTSWRRFGTTMQPREALRSLCRRQAAQAVVHHSGAIRGWSGRQILSTLSGLRRISRLSQKRSWHELANRPSNTRLHFSKNAVSEASRRATPHCKKHFKPLRSVSTCCKFLSSKPIHKNPRQADDWATAQSTLWLCQGTEAILTPVVIHVKRTFR